MATNSIIKNVDITGKKLANGFVTALEHAQKKQSKEVSFSRATKTLRRDEVKSFFDEK